MIPTLSLCIVHATHPDKIGKACRHGGMALRVSDLGDLSEWVDFSGLVCAGVDLAVDCAAISASMGDLLPRRLIRVRWTHQTPNIRNLEGLL